MMLRTLLALSTTILSLGLLLTAPLLVGCCCRTRCCPTVAATPDAPPESATTEPETASKPEPAAPAKAPSQNVRETLARKRIKGLDWEEQNLDQVLGYLRTITGVNFYLSPQAREERFDDVSISAQLDDVSVETLLSRVVTDPHDLTWEVRNGVVWILTRADADQRLRLRYYDVKDLVLASPVKKQAGPVQHAGVVDEVKMAELELRLRNTVAPARWGKDGLTMESRHGILIVRAPRPLLDQIDACLTRMRRIEEAK